MFSYVSLKVPIITKMFLPFHVQKTNHRHFAKSSTLCNKLLDLFWCIFLAVIRKKTLKFNILQLYMPKYLTFPLESMLNFQANCYICKQLLKQKYTVIQELFLKKNKKNKQKNSLFFVVCRPLVLNCYFSTDRPVLYVG